RRSRHVSLRSHGWRQALAGRDIFVYTTIVHTRVTGDPTMTVAAKDRATHGYALAQNEGEAFWLLGMLETVKLGMADTNGTSGLVEIVVPPGHGSPWHVHPEEDEWFYVLEGEVTVYVADKRFDLTSGGFAFGPKGVPHTFF